MTPPDLTNINRTQVDPPPSYVLLRESSQHCPSLVSRNSVKEQGFDSVAVLASVMGCGRFERALGSLLEISEFVPRPCRQRSSNSKPPIAPNHGRLTPAIFSHRIIFVASFASAYVT